MARTGRSVLIAPLLLAAAAAAATSFYKGEEFAERRARLLAETGDAVVAVDAALFPAEFTYLTGVKSRTAKLIIIPPEVAKKAPDPKAWRTTLYLPERSPRTGVWDDPALSAKDDTMTPTGIEHSSPESAFPGDLLKVGVIADTLYLPFRPVPADPAQLPADLKLVQQVRIAAPGLEVRNLVPVLDRLRWRKTPAQQEVMREACALTAEAFKDAARALKPGLFEYEVDAVVSYAFRRGGADEAAFLIIGSGPNSCVLHHMANDRRIGAGELVVVDIGALYGQVSTDLTRTLPSSGRFSEEQRKVYEVVLKANMAAIATVRPGATLSDVHEAARKVIADAGYEKDFIHHACHPLFGGRSSNPLSFGISLPKGFDPYLQDVPVEPGSVFTIEPGIYIPEKALGVRIEDDVLVTPDGHEVLTAAAPKTIADIEKLMTEAPILIRE